MIFLPTLAAVIAVLGILFSFKRAADGIKNDPENLEKYQRNLFIGAAISETIPIVLIVLGFANLQSVSSISELYVPMTIIIALMVFAIIYIFLQTRLDVDSHLKLKLITFGYTAMVLATAIPIIAMIQLFLMVP
ncbi:hypothetical protein [Oceanobacillus senegalensis]|uniref:hypothetical protein n=1 Tax=Oceanobacillus senegalensis TaxID=1936063 RepID=UPI000A306E2C|nr:hypothetical protein [Oceanobacillus senegalensis]